MNNKIAKKTGGQVLNYVNTKKSTKNRQVNYIYLIKKEATMIKEEKFIKVINNYVSNLKEKTLIEDFKCLAKKPLSIIRLKQDELNKLPIRNSAINFMESFFISVIDYKEFKDAPLKTYISFLRELLKDIKNGLQ